MKRTVLTSVLGAACLLGLAASSYGQGSVFFDNYDSTPYFPVKYSNGTLAGANVSVELGYALGAGQTTGFTLIPGSITSINPALLTGGYFQGPIVSIPTYVSGAITFEILGSSSDGLWSNIVPGNPSLSTYIWTEASIPGAGLPAGDFAGLTGPIVLVPTPEPTTLALAGLGGLASLVAFRRKQS
jgi:hypothetical protein